jgi:hypothetical protein
MQQSFLPESLSTHKKRYAGINSKTQGLTINIARHKHQCNLVLEVNIDSIPLLSSIL